MHHTLYHLPLQQALENFPYIQKLTLEAQACQPAYLTVTYYKGPILNDLNGNSLPDYEHLLEKVSVPAPNALDPVFSKTYRLD